jgi:hypothetical protein
MHRLQSRTYVGEPGEKVSVSTRVDGGGLVSIIVGGQSVSTAQFQLPATPGATSRMDIALAGPQGATCVVGISVVDGGSDPDFLMCSTFNPAPVNQYDFSVASVAAVVAFGAAKAGLATAAPRAAAPAKARRPAKAKPKAKSSRKGK